jgi:methionyl aminopeptidase
VIIVKNKDQIEGIKKASRILVESFQTIGPQIVPGISTKDIDRLFRDFFKSRKAIPAFLNYNGYPASICASVNDVVIHGIPDNRLLREGDILGCDVGVQYNGYISDMCYTYPVGKIDSMASKLLDITKRSLYIGIEAARNGARVKDIGKSITDFVRPYGYGIVHQFCGHGVGLELHEDPQISNNYPSHGRNPRFVPGMVVAIEPMINIGSPDVETDDDGWTIRSVDGSLSAHFEHTIVILEDRTEILTSWD